MKILVVDDSIVFRMAITQALEGEAGVVIHKSVSNGQIAVEELKKHEDIDLITLDMEMPIMDGLETIKEIRKFNKSVKILVFSSLTLAGADKTLEALNAGANDFVTKQDVGGARSMDESLEMIRQELLPKVKAFFKTSASTSSNTGTSISAPLVTFDNMPIKPKIICIGSSTGGPEALSTIFKKLTQKVNVPILLVQHMPPLFTERLAHMLNGVTDMVKFKEAEEGDQVEAGVCYIAPGDYHMTISKTGRLKMNQNEKVCFVRPSVDVLLESVALNVEQQVLSIILTGMGDDGANGNLKLVTQKRNPYIFIQDEKTSAVWGMPGAVSRKVEGYTELELNQFSELIDAISKRI